MSSRAIKRQIENLLSNQQMRLTPSMLERVLRTTRPDLTKKDVRTTIKEMVTEGLVAYTNHFNTTHLELNCCRPFHVSERIVLSPDSTFAVESTSEVLVIKLLPGGAFGIGDHPTTRLCLRGVDVVLGDALKRGAMNELQVLDIGTGSGVLAMAAVGLGAESAVGVDIDPVALHEARQNIRLNRLQEKIMLSADSLESLDYQRFGLVMANLRPPTLKQIFPMISKLSTSDAYWIFSGWREEAYERMAAMLRSTNAGILWIEKSCGWGALIAHRRYKALKGYREKAGLGIRTPPIARNSASP